LNRVGLEPAIRASAFVTIYPCLLLPFLLAACGAAPVQAHGSSNGLTLAEIEVPVLARSGSGLSGRATFTAIESGVRVMVQLAGAPPGELATHVHEIGDCSAPDAKSAGGHFNPAGMPHGLPPEPDRHLGDLGNIPIRPDGWGCTEIVARGANLIEGDPMSFLGRSLVIDDTRDDGAQPVGHEGGRIGCATIRIP
jgi:Cu-Zn family superoxide dismutase